MSCPCVAQCSRARGPVLAKPSDTPPRVDFQRREAGRGQWGWGVIRKPLSLWVLWLHLISDPRTFITCSLETQPETAPAGDGLVCAPPSVPGQVSLLRVPVLCTCGI